MAAVVLACRASARFALDVAAAARALEAHGRVVVAWPGCRSLLDRLASSRQAYGQWRRQRTAEASFAPQRGQAGG